MLELLDVVLPREMEFSKSSTELPGSAVPVKLGVVSLVRLSVFEAPESEAAIRSGVEGASGAIKSTLLLRLATSKPVSVRSVIDSAAL